MIHQRVRQVQRHLTEFVSRYYDIELSELTVESPPRIELGDLAFPFPFQLAKSLRRAPRQIASEIVDHIPELDGVDRFEAAGAGFVNVFWDRRAFFEDLYSWLLEGPPEAQGEKIIVEHTNINPNKAAHIGHLRNAVLGDTFVRILRGSGRRAEVQNYIDNTGVQVADVVVGFQYLRESSLEDVQAIPEPFDYYCWDLYAEVSEWYAGDSSRQKLREDVLSAIESGDNSLSDLAEYVSTRIVHSHLNTMLRIGVQYDVLPRESEILHLKFWEEAFELLKKRNALYFVNDGPNEGCWVMDLPGENGQQDETKIIVRSNGTVTYVGKDIAYQLWKFGLLEKTFHYRPFEKYPDGSTVWMSAVKKAFPEEPEFGGGRKVYNVIDVRQSYLQRVVIQGLRSLGFEEQAANSTHFSYEMVALSPRCCEELGIELSEEDRNRPYVEVSGRKGLGVKADDLIDKLLEDSLAEVEQRQQDISERKRKEIARQIGVGALRYFLLKYTRNSVIAFDFAEALSFEGETGPYLQYSVVRANNIFRKAEERLGARSEENWTEIRRNLWKDDLTRDLLADNEVWSLLLNLAKTPEVAEQSLLTLELSTLARHAFSIAQQFNLFYHKHHILSEEDRVKQDFYLSVTDATRKGLVQLLDLLGIDVPERM